MKKDIDFHVAQKIQIVAVKEWDKDFLAQHWNVYLPNLREDTIETVLVLSRGNSSDRKTSTLRHGLGDMAGNTASKVELITDEVLSFKNEYLVTFFAEGKLFERSFTFLPNTISEATKTPIQFLDAHGVVAT